MADKQRDKQAVKAHAPAKAAKAVSEAPSGPQAPVHVDQMSRRHDGDALEGHFCEVVDGEHKGRRGTFDRVLERGDDGYPTVILFISRDADNLLLSLPYEQVAPTTFTGGR